jgi:hypothetical protein
MYAFTAANRSCWLQLHPESTRHCPGDDSGAGDDSGVGDDWGVGDDAAGVDRTSSAVGPLTAAGVGPGGVTG